MTTFSKGTKMNTPKTKADNSFHILSTENPWTGTPGNDYYVYTGSDNFTGFGLAGNDTIIGGNGTDSLDGGDGNDYLVGSLGDTLIGGAGNDTLVGNDLNATARLFGGLGDDTYYVNSSTNITFYPIDDAGGNDTVISSASSYSLGQTLDNLTLIGNALGGLGNGLNNRIMGNNLNNSLRGLQGNDTIYGGDGDDTLYAGGVDTGRSIIDYTPDDGDDYLNGGKGNDALYGGWGKDTLLGGAGNDSLYGYIGNDSLFGGEGDDYLKGGFNYETSSDDDYLVGGAGNDTLIGDFGNDTLVGGAGNDSLVGGAGNDKYYVDSRGDVIVENADEGIDTVISSQQYLLGDNLENLTLTGTATRGVGNSLDNLINGNQQNNYLSGGAGKDKIYGSVGNDTLYGNGGDDRLFGGEGNDLLVGESDSDILFGGFGNDTLVGYGNVYAEIDTLVGGQDADTFGIGVNFARFGGGSGGLVGYTGDGDEGYAIILDWDATDVIELKGDISQYVFGTAYFQNADALDTLIYYRGSNGLDLIGVVQDTTNITADNLVFFT